jgi:hypothetical protein
MRTCWRCPDGPRQAKTLEGPEQARPGKKTGRIKSEAGNYGTLTKDGANAGSDGRTSMAQEKVRLLAMLSVAESRPNANKEAPDRRRVRGARVVDVNLGNHPDSTLDRARSKRFRRPPGPGFN